MHDNDRKAAQAASRSGRALLLVAAAFIMLAPLAGCDLELDEPFVISLEEDQFFVADVSVNVSSTATHVGACVSSGLLDYTCQGPEDSFSFLSGEEWQYAPATVPPLAGGSELTVHWSRLEGKGTFHVVVPAPLEITSPRPEAVHHLGDDITLQFSDPGAAEVLIENRGTCSGQYTYHWSRILPTDPATPGRIVVRAADLVHSPRAFDSCDVTLSVTTARQGTLDPGSPRLEGTITARATTEVSFQIVP
jgi:hypothetical protein